MMLGLSLSLVSVGPLLDSDAASFIRESGATDATAINRWVRGLKVLGLWDGILTYPMRAGQNATGATIYSLGGLTTANATQTGTPTVGANGRVITLTTENADTGWTPTAAQAALGTAFALAATGAADQRVISYDVAGTSRGLGIDRNMASSFRRLGSSFLGSFGTQSTDPTFLAVGGGNPGTFYAQDASYTDDADADLTTPFNPLGVIGRAGYPVSPGTYAFSFYYEGNLTEALYQDLRALYKDTLGTGLGLP